MRDWKLISSDVWKKKEISPLRNVGYYITIALFGWLYNSSFGSNTKQDRWNGGRGAGVIVPRLPKLVGQITTLKLTSPDF